MSSFNPTFQQIVDAYSKGQCVTTDQTEDGKFRNYTKIKPETLIGSFEKSTDGKFGGYYFEALDKSCSVNTEEGIRGFGFPACLFKTADDVILVFY